MTRKTLFDCAQNRNNNFNLMRFIAATLVLVTHSFALSVGNGDAEPLRKTLGMTLGSISVDVFFITSGFLIAGSLFGRPSIISFIWARFLRIFPALFVALIITTFGIGAYFTKYPINEYLTNTSTYRYIIKNSILFFDVQYHLPGVFETLPYKYAINGSLWTLPFEVRMYALLLIIGCIVNVIRNRSGSDSDIKRIFCMIAIVGLLGNLVNHFTVLMSVKFTHLFYMFFAGSAFYITREKVMISERICTFFIICLLTAVFNKSVFFVVYCIVLPYIILYLAYGPSGVIRTFNKVGDYSYGIYIYAFPIQQSIVALMPGISTYELLGISFVGTFILAFLSWHLIEKRALKLKDQSIHITKYIVEKCRIKSIFHLKMNRV